MALIDSEVKSPDGIPSKLFNDFANDMIKPLTPFFYTYLITSKLKGSVGQVYKNGEKMLPAVFGRW